MKKLCFLGLLSIGLGFSLSAHADGVVLLKNGRSGRVSKHKFILKFIPNDEGAKVLYALTKIPVGTQSAIKNVSGDHVFFNNKWKNKGGSIFIGLGDLKSKFEVETASGETIPFIYRLKVQKSKFMVQDCEPEKLSLAEKTYTGPSIFVGVICTKKDGEARVHVTVPGSFDLESSSLFEVAGKGERWKSFNIKQIASSSDSSTNLKYRWNNKTLNLKIKTEIGQAQPEIIVQKEESPFQFHFGVGGAQVGYTTPVQDNSSVSPVLHAQAITKPFLFNLIGRVDVNFAMPLSGLQFYSFNVGTGPNFTFGNSSFGLFLEYLALGEDEAETATSFSHSQVGGGVELRIGISSQTQFIIYGNYNGVGGDSNHIGGRLGLRYKGESGSYWGGFLGMGMQTATSQITGNDSEFSQMMGVVTYGF